MTQKELVKAVAADVNAKYKAEDKKTLTEGNVDDVIKSFAAVTTDALAKKDKIQINGFGSFEAVEKAARDGRNPKTGEVIKIAASTGCKFKAAKALKEALNS